jgi:inorganic pyrophosphatase
VFVIPTFNDDGSVNVIVESPRGATAKWKWNDGTIHLRRPLPAGLAYPYDWGFIAATLAADGDPLDAMIYWNGTSYPGAVVACRAFGVLRVEQTNRRTQQRERNDRVFMVPVADVAPVRIESALDLPERLRAELEHFFTAAVAFEKKELRLLGWGDAAEGAAAIAAAVS